MVIWFPDWPVQRRVVARPELRKKPVVVFHEDARGVRRIVSCSPLAWRWGVRKGWSWSEWEALAPQNDTIRWYIEKHEPVADREALEALADRCRWFTPLVGLEDGDEPEGLRLEITGVAEWFGGERELARRLLVWLRRAGWWPRTAIADTLGQAWGMAHFAPSMLACDRLLPPSQTSLPRYLNENHEATLSRRRRVSATPMEVFDEEEHRWLETRRLEMIGSTEAGSGKSAKDGAVASTVDEREENCWILEAGERGDFDELPVAALRLPQEMVSTFERLGILKVSQLRRLPRESLVARFGALPLQRLDQADGNLEETWEPFRAAPELHCEQGLEIPATDREILWPILQGLIEELTRRLRRRRAGVLRLEVVWHGESTPPIRWGIDFFQPSADTKHLLKSLAFKLDRTVWLSPIVGVEVEVQLDGPLPHRQLELFDSGDCDVSAASELIEVLSGRLGRERVLEVKLIEDPQPERSFEALPVAGRRDSRLALATRHDIAARSGKRRLKKIVSEKSDSKVEFTATSRIEEVLRRPLRLLRQPEPLEVISLNEGELLVEHRRLPAAFRLRGTVQRVHRYWGPERIETGWWRGPWVRRDYFRVEMTSGERYWIFRSGRLGHWFLHGEF